MNKAMEIIKKSREYIDYIEEHIINVNTAWEEIQDKCSDMDFIKDKERFDLLEKEVMEHDLSKLSEFEFVQYRKSFYSTEFEDKYNMDEAWRHHYTNNLHHWENWTRLRFDDNEWQVHCVHMVIDWMAMAYKFGDAARNYYEGNIGKINIPIEYLDFLHSIFNRIED